MIARKTSHVRRPLIAIYIAIPVLLALVVAAGAQPPADYEPRVDDRGGHALDALHAALARAERGQGRARLLFWGASHTASDQYTGVLREALARRFGDAGPGVVPGALPFELYAHRQVDVRSQGAWRALRTHGRAAERDAYGVTGVAFEAGSHARTELVLRAGVRPIDYADVLYYARPGGGSLGVRLDAGPFRTIRASGAPGSRVERVTGPARRVRLETQGSVRVFGVSLERAAPGVIVDALGIPGARTRERLPWDDEVLRAQLERLAPDLVVLAYGTNETGIDGRARQSYRREVDEALARLRRVAPSASCLLIGPSDWPIRNVDGSFAPRPRTTEVVEVQRELAARHGCAFFDLVALQGGPGSMPRWVASGLALSDHVHFTDEGHAILGRALYRALLRGYRR